MPSKIDEEPIFIGLSTKSEFFADLDEEPRFGDQIKRKANKVVDISYQQQTKN